MKIWIDDVRPAPEGYYWIKSVNNAIDAVKMFEQTVNEWRGRLHRAISDARKEECKRQIKHYTITLIDMDHDAGDYAKDGGDYIKLLDWLEETGRNYPIKIHSMNLVGVENMRRIIEKNGWGV